MTADTDGPPPPPDTGVWGLPPPSNPLHAADTQTCHSGPGLSPPLLVGRRHPKECPAGGASLLANGGSPVSPHRHLSFPPPLRPAVFGAHLFPSAQSPPGVVLGPVESFLTGHTGVCPGGQGSVLFPLCPPPGHQVTRRNTIKTMSGHLSISPPSPTLLHNPFLKQRPNQVTAGGHVL